MAVEYDPAAGAAYIHLGVGAARKTKEEARGVLLDFDSRGRLLGIELLDAKRLDIEAILRRLADRYHLPRLARITPSALTRMAQRKARRISAVKFDAKFSRGENILPYLDFKKATIRVARRSKPVPPDKGPMKSPV